MILTDEERRKFAVYCRQYADSCSKMAEQVGKMFPGAEEMLGKRERAKAAAFLIVAMHLEDGESMTIEKGDNQ